ncbi:hypothetical protein J4H65_04495 [Vibrio alginolyticus]|uniref:hypothetical protein n=1 Tax=Vibrio alginolyticus TaxID=663 RepID=UPI001BD33658|nr:hypothetical protein [Vibrio alginolyticus]MBT0074532.1 hypothetical protein [Vibrio alginolyticus]
MIIKNTTTGNAWVLPQDVQLPKGQYADMKFVETLPKEWQEAIKADIESNDAKPHMNEALGMRHTFIVEKQSVYTKHARTLVSRYKYAKKGRKGE